MDLPRPRPRVRRAGALALALIGLLAVLAPPVSAALNDVPDHTWVPAGYVLSAVRTPDRIYLGGIFSRVAPNVGGFARLVPGSDQMQGPAPAFALADGEAGTANAVIDDGAGGFYVGGRFDAVGGVARRDLAHILADGSLDPAFAPDPDGQVTHLARLGGTVYATGGFTTIGGAARTRVAAVDARGRATAWAPALDADAYAIAAAGSSVYLGGAFSTINGVARTHAGAVDAATGQTTAWDPQPSDSVFAIAPSPSGGPVYLGGAFTAVHGASPRYGVAAVDATSGLPSSWAPAIVGSPRLIGALAVSGSAVYIGGTFTTINAVARNNAAAVDATTGAPTAFDPDVGPPSGLLNPAVTGFAFSGGTAYLAGGFSTVNGGVARRGVAAVDAATGTATAWAPWLSSDASAVAISGATIGVAGGFSLVGGVTRGNAVALDAADGTPTSWDPKADGDVDAMAVDGDDVFLAGAFHHLGNATHLGLAKLSATTAVPDATWAADLDDQADALALAGRTLYVGGRFQHAGASFHPYVAAIDADSSAVLPWTPMPTDDVTSLATVGDTVYLGGPFTGVTPQGGTLTARSHLAALTSGGTLTPWNPAGANGVLATAGATVFAGGTFPGPTNVAALDPVSAAQGPLAVTLDQPPAALASDGTTLFVGGPTIVDGQPRNGLAAIDLATGTLSPWKPSIAGAYAGLTTDGRGGVVSWEPFESWSALPAAGSAPALSGGPPRVGQALTCANGSWSGSIPQRYAFAWLRDGGPIDGAAGERYVPVGADAGHALRCRVTATNLGGSAAAQSDAAVVAAAPGGGQGGGGGGQGGGGQAAPRDRTPPKITVLKLAPRAFVAERHGASIAAAKRGTKLSYRLSEPATVRFTVQRPEKGRRSGRSCVKATKRLRHAKTCTRYVAVKGSFSRTRRTAGADTLRFTGRLGGRTLTARRYRLAAVATDAAKNRSAPVRATFTVKRR